MLMAAKAVCACKCTFDYFCYEELNRILSLPIFFEKLVSNLLFYYDDPEFCCAKVVYYWRIGTTIIDGYYCVDYYCCCYCLEKLADGSRHALGGYGRDGVDDLALTN